MPDLAGSALYWDGIKKLYGEKPDEAAAEKSFAKSAELAPKAFFVHIEVGNLLLKRGAREEARKAYTDALKYAPDDALTREPIEKQIKEIEKPYAELIKTEKRARLTDEQRRLMDIPKDKRTKEEARLAKEAMDQIGASWDEVLNRVPEQERVPFASYANSDRVDPAIVVT